MENFIQFMSELNEVQSRAVGGEDDSVRWTLRKIGAMGLGFT